MTSLRIGESTVIDAGNLMESLKEEISRIDHIFLTHSHLDHINDLPYLIDATFDLRRSALKVYGTAKTLENIHRHLFCREIWADFTKITLPGSDEPAVRLIEVAYGKGYRTEEGVTVVPIPNVHIEGSCGYLISVEEGAILFSSDTGYAPELTELLNQRMDIRAAVFELSFPDEKLDVAEVSGHMTPSLLERQLQGLKRNDLHIYVGHGKPAYIGRIDEQISSSTPLRSLGLEWIEDGDTILFATGRKRPRSGDGMKKEFRELLAIAARLGAETDRTNLYREILRSARRFTHADAGTLYTLDREHGVLRFDFVQNDTLGIDALPSREEADRWPPIPLYLENGEPNHAMAAAKAALTGKIVAVSDVYRSSRYDFSGAKTYDALSGYRTVSMLVVPMKDHEGRVIGVLQLLNRKEGAGGALLPERPEDGPRPRDAGGCGDAQQAPDRGTGKYDRHFFADAGQNAGRQVALYRQAYRADDRPGDDAGRSGP
jgi:glyoxylase-like metal-dependent hydrolase (beta-lactamase superfamily II)